MQRLLRWIFKLLGLLRDPSDLTSLEYDDMDGRLNWTLPEPTARQQELSHVLIEGRLVDPDTGEAGDWGILGEVPAPETTLLITNMTIGDWEFRGTVFDTDGRSSKNPLMTTGRVDFDAPSDLQELTFTLE